MMVKHLCPLPVGLSPGEPLNGALRAAAQNSHLHVVQYQRRMVWIQVHTTTRDSFPLSRVAV